MNPGDRFGRLVIDRLARRDKHGGSYFHCVCDCGGAKVVHATNLRAGRTKSCGCLNKEMASVRSLKHGQSSNGGARKATSTYMVWSGMLDRCRNQNDAAFANYGGRGISVCERWYSFENFFADMGERPAGLSLDRRDNEGNYELSNCRWATRKEQARNTRTNRLVTIDGRTQCVAAWQEELGIKRETVQKRVAAGMAIEKAITVPVRAR